MDDKLKNLYIVGAGGMGREVLAYALCHPDHNRAWKIAGFLDDDPDKSVDHTGVSLCGTIRDFYPGKDDVFLCGIGTPSVKADMLPLLRKRGGRFLSMVHPSARIGPRVEIGAGSVIAPGVTLTCDIWIGEGVLINCHTSIGHDARVGDFATISGHCDISGGASVGNQSFLGSRVTVVSGKSVGAKAYVGAASLVLQSIKEGARVFGVPAVSM